MSALRAPLTRRSLYVLVAVIVGFGFTVALTTGGSGSVPSTGVAGAAMLEESTGGWLRLELGPFELPAGSSHQDVRQPEMRVVLFPRDGHLRGYDVEMVDGSGRRVSQRVLHHVNLIIPRERELFSEIMLRLGAAGPETGPVMLPRAVGYPVSAGDSLIVTAMFHNPETVDYRDVRMRVRLRFSPARQWVRPLVIRPFYMDVMPPDSRHSFDLPPGRTVKSWKGRPAVAGRMLAMSGHLHRHGVLLRLEDVTAGSILWEAAPVLDSAGDVVAMPVGRFYRQLGVRIHPDRVYRLTAIYENDTGALIPDGGMGALGGVILPARGARWPEPNRGHLQFLRDRELVAASHGSHGVPGPGQRHDDPGAGETGGRHHHHGVPGLGQSHDDPGASGTGGRHHH